MTILDAILLLLILYFAGLGWRLGAIKAGGYVISVFLSAFFAGWLFDDLADLVGGGNFARVAAFSIIGILVSRAVNGIIWLLDKAFKVLSIVPFTKAINSLIGAFLGLIGSILALGLVIMTIEINVINPALDIAIKESSIASVLVIFAKILLPLLPEVFDLVGR